MISLRILDLNRRGGDHVRVTRTQLSRLINEAMIGREGAPPKRINHSAKRKGGEDDLDTPISDRIMSQGKIDPMISTLYDDSIEGRRHAVQLADTLGQLTDQEHEDASFDISTEHEDFDQFRKDTYGQDDEPKYTGTDKAKKMRRDYLTRKPNVIERYLPEWKRLVLSRIKSLTPIYKRNNIPGVPPGRVEYIANQWYPGEINRALLYSRMGFDEDSGTPAGDEYDAINKELLHELSEYEENMVYMLEADGRIKIEENPYGQEYITVIPEPDEPTFTGMYPLVKKEGRLTRRQLRSLVNEVFIKPDPLRRWGPFRLPPYQPAMPISKDEYDALADLYKSEPEMAVSMAAAMGLVPDSTMREPLLGKPHVGFDWSSAIDKSLLDFDRPESEEIRDIIRQSNFSGHYDPADYPILGDNYVDQLINYHKDPRAHLGVPINEAMTRRQLRKLIKEVFIGREGGPPINPRRHYDEKMRPEMEDLGIAPLASTDPESQKMAKELYASLTDDPIGKQIVDAEVADPDFMKDDRTLTQAYGRDDEIEDKRAQILHEIDDLDKVVELMEQEQWIWDASYPDPQYAAKMRENYVNTVNRVEELYDLVRRLDDLLTPV